MMARHRQAPENQEESYPRHEQKSKERALVEQMHRDAIVAHREVPSPVDPPTIHYTQIAEATPGDALFDEWNTYRREVGRLLSEGHEGRFILIKGEEIVGIWDTESEAEEIALQKYLMQSCLIHQIRTHEPVQRGPTVLWRCHN